MIKFTNFTPSAKFVKLATQYDKLAEDNKALGCLWTGTSDEQKQKQAKHQENYNKMIKLELPMFKEFYKMLDKKCIKVKSRGEGCFSYQYLESVKFKKIPKEKTSMFSVNQALFKTGEAIEANLSKCKYVRNSYGTGLPTQNDARLLGQSMICNGEYGIEVITKSEFNKFYKDALLPSEDTDLSSKVGYGGQGLIYPTVDFAESDPVFKEYNKRIKKATAEVALLKLRQKKYVIESKKNDIDNIVKEKEAIRPLVEKMIEMLIEKTEKQIKSKERIITKLDGGKAE
jgi:hypothetical protein